MTESGQRDDADWGVLVFDSHQAGWRALRIQRWRQHPRVDTVLPADDAQLVTTLMRGWQRVEVHHATRWDRAAIGPGSVSATPPGQVTRLRWWSESPEPLDHLSVRVPAVTMRRLVAELPDRRGNAVRLPDRLAAPDPVLPGLLPGLLRAARTGQSELYAESAAEFLAMHMITTHGGAVVGAVPRLAPARVRTMQSLLHDRLAEPTSLDELAAASGLSRSHVIRVFRAATGETPNSYLIRIRMEKAQSLLGEKVLPVSEIAARCGYADSSQFARAFRRHTGSSPRQYRDGVR